MKNRRTSKKGQWFGLSTVFVIILIFLLVIFFFFIGRFATNEHEEVDDTRLSFNCHKFGVEILHTTQDGKYIYERMIDKELVDSRVADAGVCIAIKRDDGSLDMYGGDDCPEVDEDFSRTTLGYAEFAFGFGGRSRCS